MSDPLRTDPLLAARAAADQDRDAKIEQLLLVGLDHYFAAQFEQAINVWTRALFLDRNHARARAYIERARSALAERQRESEELLQNGLAAFRRGEGDEARRLLEAAMRHGAPRDEALAVIDRLNRLEQGTPRSSAGTRSGELPATLTAGSRRYAGLVLALGALAAVAAIGMFASAAYEFNWRSLVGGERASAQTPPVAVAVESTLPMPLKGETALARARILAAGGHLHDALAALEAVKPTDAQKAEADRLRADLQRQLLGIASATMRGGVQKDDTPHP